MIESTQSSTSPRASDPLLDRFSGLVDPRSRIPDDVPGKRAPVNRPTGPEPKPTWDEHPLVFKVKGVDREFFPISALAEALGRAPVTLRHWEKKGILPSSRYRAPKPKGETIPGRPVKGKRLWTREQITGILDIARETRVVLNGKAPSPEFTQQVALLFQRLIEKDTQS